MAWNTWYGSAADVIMLPKNDTACPIHSRRKSRETRSGVVSTKQPHRQHGTQVAPPGLSVIMMTTARVGGVPVLRAEHSRLDWCRSRPGRHVRPTDVGSSARFQKFQPWCQVPLGDRPPSLVPPMVTPVTRRAASPSISCRAEKTGTSAESPSQGGAPRD